VNIPDQPWRQAIEKRRCAGKWEEPFTRPSEQKSEVRQGRRANPDQQSKPQAHAAGHIQVEPSKVTACELPNVLHEPPKSERVGVHMTEKRDFLVLVVAIERYTRRQIARFQNLASFPYSADGVLPFPNSQGHYYPLYHCAN
jgi:hypothetical protein